MGVSSGLALDELILVRGCGVLSLANVLHGERTGVSRVASPPEPIVASHPISGTSDSRHADVRL